MKHLHLVAHVIALSMTFSIASEASSVKDDEPAFAPASEAAGVPIDSVIRAVAKKTGKKFIVDSRVHGNVELIGEDASKVTYSDLLEILDVQGFTAVEGGSFVRVIPDAIVRQLALPLVSKPAVYPDAQYVGVVIPVKKIPASGLVPILRPLLPQQAHLAAATCTNSILVVDTYANIKRIESIIATLDIGDSYKPDRCDNSAAHPRAD